MTPRLIFAIPVVAATLLGAALAGADRPAGGDREPPWDLARTTSDGIAVYMRETPGTTVRAAMAVCKIAAPPEVALAAAADPETFRVSTKYVSATYLRRTADPNVWYLYQRVTYPVVAPRDYALRYERRLDPAKGIYRLVWKAANDHAPPAQEGVIRVGVADGMIDIKPLPDGKGVRAVFHVVADPGGNIPGWVLRIAQRFNLPAIMRELRDEAQRRAAAP